jgi:alkanesulfonate monooxygenase SsuD/methylene tetrahydromethanopterin reductase-like flavin-dependent oxidoreductase (luciferase family)
MQFGVHLPLVDLDDAPRTLDRLSTYARRADDLDFRFLCANDHLVFRRPWLDGPTALAAVLGASGSMTIATTVALPVVRGPAPTAKLLAALEILSGGRLLAGVGPGSSAGDYLAAGVPFAERWSRFDEAVRTLRGLLGGDQEPFRGTFYATEDVDLEPRPAGSAGPPLWIASWGSEVGLRRVAELGDGWLASAYNTTPPVFRRALDRLAAAGKPATTFPHAIATMWFYVTEVPRTAARVVDELLAPLLDRSPEAVRALGLPIGSAEQCAERINAYAQAGAQRIFIWPLADELRQLELFRENVVPRISAAHG